jgi:ATP-dependent DNA ligase
MLPRVQPIIPTRRKEPFDDPDWLFEFKYDGFRALCYLDQGRYRFISRNGNVLTRFEALGEQVAAVLDCRRSGNRDRQTAVLRAAPRAAERLLRGLRHPLG